MADAMMLSFARVNRAELVTTDSGFAGAPSVTIFQKKRSKVSNRESFRRSFRETIRPYAIHFIRTSS